MLITSCLLSAAGAQAQQDCVAVCHGDYLVNTSAWIKSLNTAGLQDFSGQNYSVATLHFQKTNGAFANFYESDNSRAAGAGIESYKRINPRVVFYGQVTYQSFLGKHMGGSAFIDPYQQPLDFDEYTTDHKGSKKLERYHLNAGVGAQVSSRFTLGGGLQYETANYAKLKDLRHVNKLLNLDASAALRYQSTQTWQLGAAYHYIRRIESIQFSINGNTDEQYVSLINFGSFYGSAELFTTQAKYTSDADPYVNITHQPSVQLAISPGKNTRLFQEFSYGMCSGYYGLRGSTHIVYTAHHADQYAYTGVLTLRKETAMHLIRASAQVTRLTNKENVYNIETASSGNTVVKYHGKRDLFDKSTRQFEVAYTGYLHVQDLTPAWVLKGSCRYADRDQTTTIYPYFRTQNISRYHLQGSLERNFVMKDHRIRIGMTSGYGSGKGAAKHDGTYTDPSENDDGPNSVDTYLFQEYEYLTAERVDASITFRYMIRTKNAAPYVDLGYAATRALNVSYMGDYRGTTTLTIGCML